MRSPFCLTCLRTAPTGGEEGGEPAGAVCARSPRAGGVRAVAARWWATAHRAERGASEEHTGEHTGQCARRDSQIAKSNKKNRIVILIPRLNPRTQILRRALLKERRLRRRPEARKRWQTAKSHKLITDYGHYELKVGVRVSRDGCRPTRWHHARTCRPPPRCNVRSAAASSQEEMLPRRLVHALAAVLRMQRR